MSFEGTSAVGSANSPLSVAAESEIPTAEASKAADQEPPASGGREALSAQSDAEELSFSEEPVALVEPDALSALGQAAAARGYMWIQLAAPGPAHRGRLGLFIEETIENELEERGALPPGIVASTGLDASVSDQLYRARLIEMRGIALGIPSLEGITNLGRTLDADDSSVLRWWMAATSDRPVRLLISNQNTKLRVYPAPVFFDSLFESAPGPVSPRPPSVGMAESSASMELSDLPPQVEAAETNVFGTEVVELEPEGALSSEEEPTDVDEDYRLSESSIELSALDQALGLTPPEVSVESEESSAQADLSEIEAETNEERKAASDQLSLDYESPMPPRAQTLIATPAPPAKPIDASTAEDDELDSEEFLRTLEEDSARVPKVGGPEGSTQVEGIQEPTRKPFIRLADVQESASAPVHPPSPVEDRVEADPGASPRHETVSSRPKVPQVKRKQRPIISSQSEMPPAVEIAGGEDSFSEQEQVKVETPVKPPIPTELGDNESEQAAPRAEPASRPVPDPNDPFNQLAAQKWQSWVSNLVAARGPKPLSVIERMFVTDYTRLREAVRRGVADQSAVAILDEWRDSFTSSYADAYDALRVRGKRPTMVLDLPELAKRLGRLQGAKRVQLFLVDGMRFDLGLMVQERMRKCAAAALTERLLLWSALPSVTSHQIELLGRGPDGLKEATQLDESPALVARGRAARTPRRVRTGSLEILKLDVVEDLLREPGCPVLDRMEDIADATAEAITAHIEKLPERTMVVVFGDHGFALDPRAAGTTEEVKQGGASPEEVLVPAFAWLTGATH